MNEPGYIPSPSIIMFGCRSMTAIPASTADCPVCKGGIRDGDDDRYCGKCDSLSPRREAQVKAARLGLSGKDRATQAGKRVADRLRSQSGKILSESERRRYWNGSIQVLAECGDVTNVAKLGRDWLTSIGQVPDWSIDLSKRSRCSA
jgi:hypothetical protein